MPKKLAFPKTIEFKPWHSAAATVLVLFCVGFLSLNAVRNRPLSDIVIDDNNLSPSQVASLKATLKPIGQVQFFSSDLGQIHQAVLSSAWVQSAQVRRDWYTGVTVSVIPRQPIANFGSQYAIDASGVVFEPTDKQTINQKNMTTLHGDPKYAQDIMQQVYRVNAWFAPLGIHVKDIILTSRQTWVIRFDSGLLVIVDREDTEKKLYGLPKILQHRYKEQLSKIESVDLRYKNGFVIAWKSTDA